MHAKGIADSHLDEAAALVRRRATRRRTARRGSRPGRGYRDQTGVDEGWCNSAQIVLHARVGGSAGEFAARCTVALPMRPTHNGISRRLLGAVGNVVIRVHRYREPGDTDDQHHEQNNRDGKFHERSPALFAVGFDEGGF